MVKKNLANKEINQTYIGFLFGHLSIEDGSCSSALHLKLRDIRRITFPYIHAYSFMSNNTFFSKYSKGKGMLLGTSNFSFNSLPHKPDFERPCKRSLLKTLREKEKMLVTSIFSFSHNVFYSFQNRFQFFSHIYFVICKCFRFQPI